MPKPIILRRPMFKCAARCYHRKVNNSQTANTPGNGAPTGPTKMGPVDLSPNLEMETDITWKRKKISPANEPILSLNTPNKLQKVDVSPSKLQ